MAPTTSITDQRTVAAAGQALAGKRVVVMGLGRFGGGVGVTRFLVRRGADVLVTDQQPRDKLTDSIGRLADLPIEYRLGEHHVDDFEHADLIVVNPAVKPAGNVYLDAARRAGAAISSEIRLLVASLPNRLRTIGVTGTAGKSTVTAMIGHVLSKAREQKSRKTEKAEKAAAARCDDTAGSRVWVGGNLGGSLLDQIEQIGPDDWVVLELSSFMLHGLREDRWSPHIAVVTNVTPNHLDWHGSFEDYALAKRTILDFQQRGDVAIATQQARRHLEAKQPCLVLPDTARISVPLLVPGEHNRRNARLAASVAQTVGVDGALIRDALAEFPGLPHRLQLVGEHAGVRYVNDSKSTTPEAATLAIQCFEPGVVHAILGGYDKGSDLTGMARVAAQRSRAVYTIGATGDAIAAAAQSARESAEIVRCETLERAVAATVSRVRGGDVVLLSPGCASWDQFDHYEQRGAAFVDAVRRHTGQGDHE